MHCKNYLCGLHTGCICPCDNCKIVYNSAPCIKCGYCPTCGRSEQPVSIPYMQIYMWFCWACQISHPFGYQCLKFSQPQIIYNGSITTDSTNLIQNWMANTTLGVE